MKFRLVADEARLVSILPTGDLRKVEPDEVFTVPDEHADSYEIQPHYYEPLNAPKKTKGD